MESFREKLDEIKRVIDEDVHRRRVLLLCQQPEPKSFDEYSSSGSFRRLEKFESSTYSEVLKAIDLADNNKPVVMKIMRGLSRGVMRRLPSIASKGCQSYNDILSELVITQALSQLHDGVILNGQPNALYRTHFFCLIHEIKVVSGNLSRQLGTGRRRPTPRVRLGARAAPANSPRASPGAEPAETGAPTSHPSRLSSAPLSESPSVGKPNETLSSDFVSASPTDPRSTPSSTQPSADVSSASAHGVGPKMAHQLAAKEPAEEALGSPTEKTKPNNQGSPAEVEESGKFQTDKEPEKEVNRSALGANDLSGLNEEERMLMEALPHEYVVTVMRHDGQPLWWMMTHKKLTAEQLTSILVQVIVGLAIAETVYLYEHRDLHVSNILIKRTSNEHVPFILSGQRYNIVSQGVKATIIDATFSRLTHNGKVYHRDLTSTLRAYGTRKTPPKMSLQNRSYRQMVRLTRNRWDEFTPKTNLIWLTYLCETLMKNEIMRGDQFLLNEIKKIRDHTLKVKTSFDLLACFPFQKTGEAGRANRFRM